MEAGSSPEPPVNTLSGDFFLVTAAVGIFLLGAFLLFLSDAATEFALAFGRPLSLIRVGTAV